MPWLVAVVLLAALVVHPAAAVAGDAHETIEEERPLVTAEVRAAYGVMLGGGAGRASLRGSPLVLAARVAVAIREEPWMTGYGGLVVETLDRTGIGAEAGVALEPTRTMRLRGGAIAMVAPYRLWGAAVGGGRCFARAPRVCVDLDADVFVGGSDLPAAGAAVQVMLGLGVGFDAR